MNLLFYKLASFTVTKREYKQNNVDMSSTRRGVFGIMETLKELETVNFSKNMRKVSTSASYSKCVYYEVVVFNSGSPTLS